MLLWRNSPKADGSRPDHRRHHRHLPHHPQSLQLAKVQIRKVDEYSPTSPSQHRERTQARSLPAHAVFWWIEPRRGLHALLGAAHVSDHFRNFVFVNVVRSIRTATAATRYAMMKWKPRGLTYFVNFCNSKAGPQILPERRTIRSMKSPGWRNSARRVPNCIFFASKLVSSAKTGSFACCIRAALRYSAACTCTACKW